jgi:hypothetical protein
MRRVTVTTGLAHERLPITAWQACMHGSCFVMHQLPASSSGALVVSPHPVHNTSVVVGHAKSSHCQLLVSARLQAAQQKAVQHIGTCEQGTVADLPAVLCQPLSSLLRGAVCAQHPRPFSTSPNMCADTQQLQHCGEPGCAV